MKRTGSLISAVLMAALTASVAAQTGGASPEPSLANNSAVAPAPAKAALSDEADPVQPATQAAHSYGPVSFRRSGLWFSTKDGSTHLQVHGYLQADDRMFSSSTKGEELDTFLFRRLRPLFEGTLFSNVDFRFMPDFGQNNPQIQEAYLELTTDAVEFRAAQGAAR